MFKKTLTLLLILTLLLPMLPGGDKEVNAASGNLLRNPGFEDGEEAWTFKGQSGRSGAGIQTNNPRSGSRGFFLDGTNEAGLGNFAIEQEITVPYTGTYKASAYISTGGAKSAFGIRAEDGTVLSSIVLPQGAKYNSAHLLAPVKLKQDDKVTVYVSNGTGWTNGDDISFEYDPSSIIENLMSDDSFNQMVRIPRAGDYILTAKVSGEGEVTITTGAESGTITATEAPQEVKLLLTDLALDEELVISATAGAVITDYSLLFDVSSFPNEAPTASDVAMSGIAWSGQTLVGSYTFADEDGHTEGNSRYQWYVADSADGEYNPLPDETTHLLELKDEDEGKFYKFSVTPVDSFGKSGDEVMSDAAAGPVKINYVRNYSFDIEINQSPAGWKFANGGNAPNNKASARTGFRYGSLPANTPDAEIAYGFTVEKTAVYELSMYINSASAGTEIGVRYQGDSSAIQSMQTTKATSGYEKVTLTGIVLEKGGKAEVYAKGGAAAAVSNIDDVEMFIDPAGVVPDMANLFSFKAEKQLGDAVINSEDKTITFKVPYGTDVTALNVVMEVSEGATISPSTENVDFTEPVVFTISKHDVSHSWTASAIVMPKMITLNSSNEYLQDAFNWAVDKTRQFVMTGKSGPINVWAGASGTGPVEYIPSYWAGYYDRSAFYSRDFVHQATGAQIAGLADENYSMFQVFAKAANASRKWYTLWAFNFDGSNYLLDYNNDNNFVREVPAQFELVQRAYEQYRWTGDERYINDPTLFKFYTKVMNDYVILHDTNDNGLAEGTGTGNIFAGSSTYNERGSEHPIESGDSVGSQYQAMLAYAGILHARGEEYESEKWFKKAADLKTYFNEEWSVVAGYDGSDPGSAFARGLAKDGTKYVGFGKENSWFMPMKLITEPGPRHDAYMEFIEENLGNGIGTTPEAPHNIEAYTYIPDMYFPYNKADLAWKWMKYIISVKDKPHERPVQGTNGDYPEISYTFVSHVIEGMMGIEPNAGEHSIITAPRLPSEVADVEALYIPVGEHEVSVKHSGLEQTTVSNIGAKELAWEARFYGDYDRIIVDGKAYEAAQKDINGVQVSYVTVTVPANGAMTAKAVADADTSVLSITMEDQSVKQGAQFTVPVYATDANGLKEIAGEIEYDQSLLTVKSFKLVEGFEQTIVNTATAGKIVFAGEKTIALDTHDKTPIANIVFTATGKQAATTNIALQNVKVFKVIAGKLVEVASTATGAAIEIKSMGGSTNPTPEVPAEKPIEPEQTTDNIKIKPELDASGQAKAIVKDSEIADILQNKKVNQVNVIVDIPAAANSFAVELGKNAIDSLAISDKPLVVTSSLGEIQLDKAALAQLSGNDVVITIESARDQYNRPSFTVAISAGGKQVTDIAGAVMLTIPHAKQAGEVNECIVLYRIEGDQQIIVADAVFANGKITFASEYLSTFVVGYNAHNFTDVTNHWAKKNIDFVTARQLFVGVAADKFAPNETMTRGMLVTVLGRLHGIETSGEASGFIDVAADKYYSPYIEWASEHALVNGIGGGKFAPDRAVTREELAKIIASYASFANMNFAGSADPFTFADEDAIAPWAFAAVKQMQAAGIIEGKSNKAFDAKGTATRAEVAKILTALIVKKL